MQFKKIIPFFYWPSTVAMVDDDQRLVVNITDSLKENVRIKGFIEPEQAIEAINQAQQDDLLKDFVNYDAQDDDNDAVAVINLDTSKLVSKAYDPKRFDLITMILMDYNLPQKNGLYYIQKLEDPSVQKLLLTGYAKPDEVINAFNDHVIDKYIGKHEHDAWDVLPKEIDNIQPGYFEKLTRANLHSKTKLHQLLSDKDFISFFNDFIKEHDVREFYLLDYFGSFLMVDGSGKSFILAMTNEEELSGLKLFLEGVHGELAAEYIDGINNKTKMPFFLGSETPYVTDWPKYIYDCQAIKGSGKGTGLFYAVIDDIKKYGVKAV